MKNLLENYKNNQIETLNMPVFRTDTQAFINIAASSLGDKSSNKRSHEDEEDSNNAKIFKSQIYDCNENQSLCNLTNTESNLRQSICYKDETIGEESDNSIDFLENARGSCQNFDESEPGTSLKLVQSFHNDDVLIDLQVDDPVESKNENNLISALSDLEAPVFKEIETACENSSSITGNTDPIPNSTASEVNVDVNQEPAATTSRRDRCVYGVNCYR